MTPTPPPIPDALWQELRPLIDAHEGPHISGRKRLDRRAALDTILYREITGCPWNRLPAGFPDDSTVNRIYRHWRASGLLELLFARIVAHRRAREPAGTA